MDYMFYLDRITIIFPSNYNINLKFQGEVDGVSYHYVDKETIDEMIQNDEFIGKKHALKIYDQFSLNTSCF